STITSPKAYKKNLNANLPGHTTGSLRLLQTTPTASESPSWLAPHYPASSQTPLHYLQAPIPPLAARFGSWNQVPETKTPISSRYQPMMKSVCTSARILMCSLLCCKVPVSFTPNSALSNWNKANCFGCPAMLIAASWPVPMGCDTSLCTTENPPSTSPNVHWLENGTTTQNQLRCEEK